MTRRIAGVGISLAALGALLALMPAAAGAATITPDITADEVPNADADCSLREAVQAAADDGTDTTGCTNGDAGTDEISPGPPVDRSSFAATTQMSGARSTWPTTRVLTGSFASTTSPTSPCAR